MIRKTITHLWRFISSLQQIVANTLLLLLLAAIITSLSMLKPAVPDHAVLKLTIHGALSEQIAQPSLAGLPFSLPDTSQTATPDLVQALNHARTDPRISGVWLDVSDMERAPLARITTVTDAIDRFRSSGKPVAIYGDSFSPSQYLIATAADRITLHPTGLVALTSPAATRHYFKSTLDKLSISVELFRTGKYKSFAEPMTRNNMSAAARDATQQWLTQWWQQIKQRLASRRHIAPKRLQQLLDDPQQMVQQSQGDFASFALNEGVVDALDDRVGAQRAFNQQLHSSTPLPQIDINDYLLATEAIETPKNGVAIGIIRASGEIVPGEHPASVIGGDSLAKLIDKAANNSAIDAVVLRIDSPGGSATAAETIHKSLLRLKKAGKPLVVSMGGIAASGGYWIASAADEIWAQPATLTGSIGVFAMVPDISRAMQRLGIQIDSVNTSALTNIRPDRPLDAAQKALLQSGVEFIYRSFLQRVATGRGLPLTTVEKIAEGRVWSGIDAQRLGLVDNLGDLPQAVHAAAKRAGSPELYHTVELRERGDIWQRLSSQLLSATATLLPPELRTLLHQLHTLTTLHDPRGIYAYTML
ncbi:MAG: signal peptide peptidase SppA [Mariprofundales bacterium]|nr:signal peptide peptidase SppA [Mariprofundales bacterium]